MTNKFADYMLWCEEHEFTNILLNHCGEPIIKKHIKIKGFQLSKEGKVIPMLVEVNKDK